MEKSGRYELLKKLGTGGMGKVYLAFDPLLGRNVALKILSKVEDDNELEIINQRFLQEAKILAKLNHPNIVRIYDINPSPPYPYISMEYVDGINLDEYFEQNPHLNILQKIKIIEKITNGLSAIHAEGLIHRDIKDTNIMVDRTDEIKIMDFGISKDLNSKLNLTSGLIGSPLHMSPEQISGKDLGQKSDIFSLGIIMYELFYGVNPFVGETLHEVLNNIITQSPDFTPHNNLIHHPGITNIISMCLEKNIEKRMNSCEKILNLLKIEEKKYLKNSSFKKNIHKTIRWPFMLICILFFLGCLGYFLYKKDLFVSHIISKKNEPISYLQLLEKCENLKQCKTELTNNVSIISKRYPSLVCGDAKCTFLEKLCLSCNQDCPNNSTEKDLSVPACINFIFPLKPTKLNLENDQYRQARMIFDHCSFQINNEGLTAMIWSRSMLSCLDKSKNDYIIDCQKKYLQNSNTPMTIKSFFGCIVAGDSLRKK